MVGLEIDRWGLICWANGVTKYLRIPTNHLIAGESPLGKNEARGILRSLSPTSLIPYWKNPRSIRGRSHHASFLPGDGIS